MEKYKAVDYVDVVEEQSEPKKKRLFEKVKSEAMYIYWNVDNWIHDHKEDIVRFIGVGSVGITAVAGLMRAANNIGIVQQRKRNANDRVYWDPSARHYWTLRRNLTNSEWEELDRRHQNGERIGDILSDMKVLK